jgi:uncharacterized protein
MSSLFNDELGKPSDGSDLTTPEASIEEVKRLRKLFQEVVSVDSGAESAAEVALKPALPAAKRTPALRFAACVSGDAAKLAQMLIGSSQEELNAVNDDDETMLCLAAANGKSDCTAALIKAGCDLNMKDDFGKTAMRLAVGAPKNKIGQGHYDCLKLLLDAKADTEVVCDYGWTPLHKACEMGYAVAVKMLIEGGANVNIKEAGGETPLDKCTEKEHADCIELIKAAGGEAGGD